MNRRGLPAIDSDPEVQQIAKVLGILGPNLKAKLVQSAVERVAGAS